MKVPREAGLRLMECLRLRVKALRDLHELVLQFDQSPEGRRFIQAWKNARNIVDAGGGNAADDAPPAPASMGRAAL